jgi:NAD(P)-dependent dehydrogenase (short-subunit alcohol dehydrogenase family)
MELGLSGKTAVVSGASKGIGAAIAAELCREGCQVAILARDVNGLNAVAREISGDEPDRVLPVRCDVLSRPDVDAAISSVMARYGGVDILVNNAGGARGIRAFEDVSDEDWIWTFELNVMSAVRLTRAVLPLMIAKKWGRIINISSESAVQPDATMPDYNSAKGALNTFTKSLSKSHACHGILANVVAPAFMESEALRSFVAKTAADQGTDIKTAEQYLLKTFRPHIEVGRMGRAEEAAAAVAFLASDRASFINCCVLRVDGGSVTSI